VAKRRDKVRAAAQESAAWVVRELAQYADGLHTLSPPAYMLDSELPEMLAEVYRAFDGCELFHESLLLSPSSKLRWRGDRVHVGTLHGDELLVDRDGAVWRLEQDTGELLCEGSRFDRWLAGYVTSEAIIYEVDGEFRDEVIDEDGELTAETAARRERAVLERDARAPAPRWRLARLLVSAGKDSEARELLEQVVADVPEFAWCWFDLARISERLGQRVGATDEFETAAEVAGDGTLAAFFWAHAARSARAMGDEDRRRSAASRALELHPSVAREQADGARAHLEEGDREAALELAEIAYAIKPKDLDVLALVRSLGLRPSP